MNIPEVDRMLLYTDVTCGAFRFRVGRSQPVSGVIRGRRSSLFHQKEGVA